MCAAFSGVSRSTAQGVETRVQVSRESHPSGTDKVSTTCTVLFTTLLGFVHEGQPTVILRVSAMTKVNDWICARQITHHDLANVIRNKKKEKEKRTDVKLYKFSHVELFFRLIHIHNCNQSYSVVTLDSRMFVSASVWPDSHFRQT